MAGTAAVSAVYMGLHLSPVFVGGLVVVNAAGLLYTQSPSAAATPEERHTILDKASKSTDLELQPLLLYNSKLPLSFQLLLCGRQLLLP